MKIHLLDLGKTINLKAFQKQVPLKMSLREPLVIHHEVQKHLVVLRYGVVAFWNMNRREEKKWLKTISPFIVDPFENPLEDTVTIVRSPKREGVFRGRIFMKSFDPHRIGLLTLILGRSLALERYETEAEKALTDFDSVMKSFGETGSTSLSTKDLLKKVGFAMNLKHITVSQMALLDKPDLTWEEPELDKLYNNLALDYELEDRYDILTEKMKLIFNNVEFIIDYIDARRSITLEAVIVLLIIFEIILFLVQIFGFGV